MNELDNHPARIILQRSDDEDTRAIKDLIYKLETEINTLVAHMKAVEHWNNRFGVYVALKVTTQKALRNYRT